MIQLCQLQWDEYTLRYFETNLLVDTIYKIEDWENKNITFGLFRWK